MIEEQISMLDGQILAGTLDTEWEHTYDYTIYYANGDKLYFDVRKISYEIENICYCSKIYRNYRSLFHVREQEIIKKIEEAKIYLKEKGVWKEQ